MTEKENYWFDFMTIIINLSSIIDNFILTLIRFTYNINTLSDIYSNKNIVEFMSSSKLEALDSVTSEIQFMSGRDRYLLQTNGWWITQDYWSMEVRH